MSGDVLREVGAMKDRIENEVVRAGELERNVKLGRGGIREVEFIEQIPKSASGKILRRVLVERERAKVASERL